MEKDPGDIFLNSTRFRIALLVNPTARSASEIARALDVDLKLATFHLRKLVKHGMTEGKYQERIVQNRPLLIKYYTLTARGIEHLRRIKNKIDV